IMLYHDDESLTFDLVWDNGGWRSATLENVS
ncbi:TPA: anti-adapter protein IraD, partial [Escherichia coli]